MKRHVMQLTTLVVVGAGMGLVAGCGNDLPQQKTYPVTGSVTLDGRPLAGATVVFHAVDKSNFKWGELPQGTTDQQGKFKLFTYSSEDGAPVGEYTVAIELAPPSQDEGDDQVKWDRSRPRLPDRYLDPAKSGFKVRIEPKSNELPAFDVKSK